LISLPIETENCLVRLIEKRDARAYHRLESDPEVKRFLGGPTTADVQSYCRKLATLKPQLDAPLAITRKRTGEFLGSCGFAYDAFLDAWEVNVVLQRATWHQGLAKEILPALCALDSTDAISLSCLRSFT
jgi:RimJ/RimL family protein N-acetyltransferase